MSFLVPNLLWEHMSTFNIFFNSTLMQNGTHALVMSPRWQLSVLPTTLPWLPKYLYNQNNINIIKISKNKGFGESGSKMSAPGTMPEEDNETTEQTAHLFYISITSVSVPKRLDICCCANCFAWTHVCKRGRRWKIGTELFGSSPFVACIANSHI